MNQNGKSLDRSYIRQDETMSGGVLHFVMEMTPNKTWATALSSRPYSMTAY